MADDALVAEVLAARKPGVGDRSVWNSLRGKYPQLTRNRVRTIWMNAGPAASTGLSNYDQARRALAEAKTFDEVREWEDKGAAVREYSRRARNRDLELDALEIRERARRRRGEMLIELKDAGFLYEGQKELCPDGNSSRVTLDEIDVTAKESSRDQKIAKLEPDAFERLLAKCRTYAEEHPEKHTFDILRAPEAPINGARSVMGSRIEAADSLDFFPTPPWATRALCEAVLPTLYTSLSGATVWEPACGEGHMAYVLTEYAAKVYASDIAQYRGGVDICDFTERDTWPNADMCADWVITNPPFGDLTIPFVLNALDAAKDGVAMFVRSQWAVEGIERFEKIFRPHPPTLMAFFTERVPLCKGRWDPDGSTATAYCWLVWRRGHALRPPMWIPPGQRERLTRPDDRERFAGALSHG
jgi:predicted RNA methylase